MPGGRPTKLTPALQQKICDAVRSGNYLETAAAFAGIDKTTLYEWLRKGARTTSGVYHTFSEAVQKSLADAEARDVALIAKAASEGVWQASAWRLERKFPDRWGRRDRLDATVRGGVAHAHMDLGRMDLSRVTDEELATLEKLYEKVLPAPGGPPGSGPATGEAGKGTSEPA